MTTAEASVATPRRSRARWIAPAVFLLIAALIVVLATRPAADSKITASPLVGQPAPTFSGTAFDGRVVDLAEMRGRHVVVNFFATWCQPCRLEHPELIKFTEAHQGPTSPTVVAVAYDENDVDAARNFFSQNGGTWPVVPDNGGNIAVDYGVRGLPESFVIDPDGNIAAHITGQITEAELNQLTGQVS